jgi:hypothetical protein
MSFFNFRKNQPPSPEQPPTIPASEQANDQALDAAIAELEALEVKFDQVLDQAIKTGQTDEAVALKTVIEQKLKQAEVLANPFEKLLSLEAQYNRQKDILKSTNILEVLSTGELGIKGIDNREYPFPTLEAITARLKERKETMKEKIDQGFSRLLIVPFGLSLDNLITKASQVILKHHREGKLFTAKKDPDDQKEALVPLELNEQTPLWAWDKWTGSDRENGQAVYHPKSLDANHHQGQTKKEILDKQQETNSPLQGWNVLLLESKMNIPAADATDEIKGGRARLKANQTPTEYLNLLHTNPQYKNEQGLANEDWLTLFITHLEQTNQIIDDWQGNGKACFLPGSFLPSSRDLGYGCWNRDYRQAFLNRPDSAYRHPYYGLRVAVGL